LLYSTIMKNSYADILKQLCHELASLYPTPDEQYNVALLLVQKVTGLERAQLIASPTLQLTREQKEQLVALIKQHRDEHKPLAYMLGSVPFGELEILIKPPILIPRPETEEWVMHLAQQLKKLNEKKLSILDMCTGSGAIALALAQALPHATVYAVDIQEQALALAQENARHNTIRNVIFVHSDLFAQLPSPVTFDLIVSNPPYISEQEYAHLEASVTQWEDRTALVAHDNGLAIIQALVQQARTRLTNNQALENARLGNLYCEIGYAQGNALQQLFKQYGYKNVHIITDLAGRDRVVYGFYK
jgi:release factor glutamine methyltransferase